MIRKMILIYLLLNSVIACKTMEEEVSDNNYLQVMMLCGGGIVSHNSAGAKLETDLDKAVKEKKLNFTSKVQRDKFIKAWYAENMPEKDRKSAMVAYIECVDKRMGELVALPKCLDKKIINAKEEASKLEGDWKEAQINGVHMPISSAKDYANVGSMFKKIKDSDLDLKNNIIRYDRQALMYLISAEILIGNEKGLDQVVVKNNVNTYSNEAYKAVKKEYKYLQDMQSKGYDCDPTWITDNDVNYVVHNRQAEIIAQQIYLGLIKEDRKLTETLNNMTCDEIKNAGFPKSVFFSRIESPERVVECSA